MIHVQKLVRTFESLTDNQKIELLMDEVILENEEALKELAK